MKKELTEEQKINRQNYQKEWRQKHKESLTEYYRNYKKENPEVNKINTKKYRENNPEKAKKSSKEYKKKNQDKVKNYANSYKTRRNELDIQKKTNDPLYALKVKIRSSISKSLKRKSIKKTTKTSQILGCSFDAFRIHIESKFESWMTWSNRGLYNGELNYGWDIDHIIPLASAKSEADVIKLNHYTNFQPLCSKINRDIKNRFY